MAWRPRLVSMPIISMICVLLTDEFGEVDPLRFPKRPSLWTHALGEKGDHLRVERVGLGQAAHRAGEVSDLARVNDTERQPNAGQSRRNSGFEAASRL